jgi:CheY-like chemotaxis protein
VGTAFHIYLPCPDKEISIESVENEVVTGAGHVLLIEDEEVIRVSTQHLLEEAGYTVTVAENGSEGVTLFAERQHSIDLVLMDMIMPVMSGREAFYKMKEIAKDCKVIVASGFSKNNDIEDMKAHGLYGFIQKPYKNSALTLLIHNALYSE